MNSFKKITGKKSPVQNNSLRNAVKKREIYKIIGSEQPLDKKSTDKLIENIISLDSKPGADLRSKVIEKLKQDKALKKQQSMSIPVLNKSSKKSSASSKKSSASSKNSVYEADKYLPLLRYTNF